MAKISKSNPSNSELLTEKQKVFCEEYLIDFNGARAAIAAGYSEKSARVIAFENLTKLYIQQYLALRMAERAKRLQISQDAVLEELQHIAFDDISNYLDFRCERQAVGSVEGETVYGYRTIVDVKDSQGIDTRNVQEVSVGSNGVFKFKLYSKDEALSQLGRHLGLFKDKLELNPGSDVKDISISFVDKTKASTQNEKDPKIVGEYTNPIDTKERGKQ